MPMGGCRTSLGWVNTPNRPVNFDFYLPYADIASEWIEAFAALWRSTGPP